jgi:hypothetical protein
MAIVERGEELCLGGVACMMCPWRMVRLHGPALLMNQRRCFLFHAMLICGLSKGRATGVHIREYMLYFCSSWRSRRGKRVFNPSAIGAGIDEAETLAAVFSHFPAVLAQISPKLFKLHADG